MSARKIVNSSINASGDAPSLSSLLTRAQSLSDCVILPVGKRDRVLSIGFVSRDSKSERNLGKCSGQLIWLERLSTTTMCGREYL